MSPETTNPEAPSPDLAESTPPRSDRTRDIPSLDGLRAVSIGIVILAHTKWYLPHWIGGSRLFGAIVGGGLHGVQIFFVISGYLITTLLLREADKTQTISFRRFYARRSLRIFPPFYVYLAVLGILWAIGTIPEHLPSFLAAASYTLIYLPHPQGWFIQHAWSLSVEEQFYLLWPLLLLWSYRRRKSVELAVAIIAVMPVMRAILHWIALAQGADARDAFVVSGSIDTLMAGCLLAMLARHLRWEQWHRRYIRGWTAGAMFVVGFIGVPYLTAKLKAGAGSFMTIALAETVTSLCIGGILVYVVANERSIAGRFLNAAPVRHIGVISYSLYLWQQLFSGEELRLLPYGYLFALAAAEASFWLIERPVLRLRSRMRV